ncbi:glutaminase [Streptomyces rubiginosohelvolus]|uniref:glutaminase n=1 Tax=Streptomyces rubiginosohelvolus TaxID=67362 RepID=A0ABW6F4Z3_9ACTN
MTIDTEFTIQSISKPFAYALALADRRFAPVLAKVGVEPSGEAFNEISLESDTGRPRNPMINAGAITVHSLAGPEGLNATERVERVVDGLSAFAGRRLRSDEAVYASEMKHAHRNLAIAHMLRSHDILVEDARAVVDGYTRQCSVLVSTRDLAMMADPCPKRIARTVTPRERCHGLVGVRLGRCRCLGPEGVRSAADDMVGSQSRARGGRDLHHMQRPGDGPRPYPRLDRGGAAAPRRGDGDPGVRCAEGPPGRTMGMIHKGTCPPLDSSVHSVAADDARRLLHAQASLASQVCRPDTALGLDP